MYRQGRCGAACDDLGVMRLSVTTADIADSVPNYLDKFEMNPKNQGIPSNNQEDMNL